MTIHSPGVAADAIAGPADSAAMGPALSRAAAVVAAGMLHAAIFRDSGDPVTNRMYDGQDLA